MLKEKGETAMKCVECQNEIPEGIAFCPICASAVFEEPVTEVKKEPALVPEEAPPAKKKKKWWILAAAGMLAVVAAVAVVSFAAFRPSFAVYATAHALFLTDLSDGEPVKLAEFSNTRAIVMTEDQKHLFYMAEVNEAWPNDLYHLDLRSGSKEPEKLAEEVSQFYANAKGTRLSYIRDGDLYVHDLKTETLIAEAVDYYLCDEDIDTFVYATMTKVGDSFALSKKWYFMDGNMKPDLVGGDGLVETLRFTADGKRLIYADDGGLYVREGNREIVIAENATLAGGVYEDGSFYYQTVNDADQTVLFFYDGKRSVEIPANESAKLGNGSRPVLVWQDEQSGQYYVAIEERVLEIPLEQVTSVKLSGDGNALYVTTQGKENSSESLYMVDISWGRAGKVQLLVKDAARIYIHSAGKRLYYWVDEKGTLGTLYCDGKQLLQDVQSRFQVHEETETILMRGEASSDGLTAVYMVRGGKTIKLTDEGKQVGFATNGDPLVLTGKGELWCFDRNGAGKWLVKHTTDFYYPEKPQRPSSIIYWNFDYN